MLSHKKNDLRKALKVGLRNISLEDRLKKENLLKKNILKVLNQLELPREFVLGGYAPLADEASWVSLVDEINNLITAFPATSNQNEFSMNFYQCRLNELVDNTDFGVKISIPPNNSPLVIPDLLFVPGLGFSKKGDRIGRGKGYYDRYLENYHGHRLGICFEEQITTEIPTDEYDQNLHIVITDKNIYYSNPA